jgi:hypothetical protein
MCVGGTELIEHMTQKRSNDVTFIVLRTTRLSLLTQLTVLRTTLFESAHTTDCT